MPEQHDRPDDLTVAITLSVVAACGGVSPSFVKYAAPAARAQSAGQPAQPTPQQSQAAQQAVAVGSRCIRCHRPIVQAFTSEAHGKSAKFMKDSLESTCDSCHGDPNKHIRSMKAEDIINPAKLEAGQADESCLKCHSRDHYLLDWRGGRHERKDMSCMSCHSVHHAKSEERELASISVEETCFRCHSDVRKTLYQRSTHLFRTENWVDSRGGPSARGGHAGMKVDCVTCHNPHGSEGPKMLQAVSTNDLCYQCHAEKRGPFLWEHAPVQENCMTCHKAHGSNYQSLLTTRSHQLCQQCHINLLPRHSTVAGFDVFTFNRGCVNCHSQVHGSNHPSGRTFTR